jgi:ribosome-associated protein
MEATGLAETGGQAKLVIREGMVRVNGAVETRPGAQLAVGDTIAMGGEAPWRVVE